MLSQVPRSGNRRRPKHPTRFSLLFPRLLAPGVPCEEVRRKTSLGLPLPPPTPLLHSRRRRWNLNFFQLGRSPCGLFSPGCSLSCPRKPQAAPMVSRLLPVGRGVQPVAPPNPTPPHAGTAGLAFGQGPQLNSSGPEPVTSFHPENPRGDCGGRGGRRWNGTWGGGESAPTEWTGKKAHPTVFIPSLLFSCDPQRVQAAKRPTQVTGNRSLCGVW